MPGMTVHEFNLPDEPIDGLLRWLEDARAEGVPEHVAMTLSTVSNHGQPSSRIVYFKGLSTSVSGERCPRFFTNYDSQKSHEMSENSRVSLLFYWPVQWRQVRIEGRVEKVSYEESDAYFQSRARGSRIGAWASPQSSVIKSREDLEALVAEVTKRFEGKEIPCPPFWGGWRVSPSRIEFWHGGDSRLHDREVFERAGHGWKRSRLAP
jgi:pyridoxamine 5'-phosphate oxidase